MNASQDLPPFGRVWRVGRDVDTDALAPGPWMKHAVPVIAAHCLEALRPEFAAGVRPGDVLVAGPNFGIGSSREQAAAVLRHLGLAAVVAPSYGGLFLRNAFNLGLPLLSCRDAEALADGEAVRVDVGTATVVRADGSLLRCQPLPEFLLRMIEAGGLLPMLKRRVAAGAAAAGGAGPDDTHAG